MKRLILFGCLSCILAGTAMAGEKTSDPVVISKEGWASGSFGSARNSSDSNQVLVCGLSAYADPDGATFTDVNCFARTARGITASCSRVDAPLALREAVMAMRDAAHVKFVWNVSNECIAIQVSHSSGNAPRQ